ncbi:MAG: 3-hydroxyisobutyrate dehydrogenase-like beta-hydroxyacid dehydrogenase [Lentimonas sp.]|jgi:3-hydroxyisobutyrate dehydrogenase-like beta-hydroxyacid dehydrogenase
MNTEKIAIIGLGLIGSIWAAHYQTDGFLAASWNRTPKPELDLMQATLAECAERATLLQICLYDAASIESVLDQLLPHLTAKHCVIQSSTIDSASAERMALRVRATGAGYVESPFTGSKPAAEVRKTVFFMGGESADIARVQAMLAQISTQQFHIGAPAQAATIKLAMNLQIAAITQALCESITMSRDAGIEDDTFFSVMKQNVAWSGLAALKEPKLRDSDFAPQFSIKNMHKDMRLAQQSSEGQLPILKQVCECLNQTEAAGHGEDDFISLIKALKN